MYFYATDRSEFPEKRLNLVNSTGSGVEQQQVVARTIRPLTVVGKLCGLVPLGTMLSGEKAGAFFEVLIPLTILIVMLMESTLNVIYVDRKTMADVKINFATIFWYVDYMGRTLAVVILVVSLKKSSPLQLYVSEWKAFDDLLMPFEDQMQSFARKRFWILASLLAFFVISISYLNSINLIGSIETVWFSLRTFTVLAEFFIACYFPFSCAVFCEALKLGFQDIHSNLQQELFATASAWTTDQARKFLLFREMHQKLTAMVVKTGRVSSPILTLIIISQTISLCFNLYIVTADQHWSDSHGVLDQLFVVGIVCARLAIIFVLCFAANNLTKEVSSSLQLIYKAPHVMLSDEGKFQLQLIESKMASYPVTLTVSGFLTVDNGLLLQILGIVVSFCVAMMQGFC